MKKLLSSLSLISLWSSLSWGQNVVFNPGFDMTPWDTGWTIEIDTAAGGGDTAWAITRYGAGSSVPGMSPPNCCSLYTNAGWECFGWISSGRATARITISQDFNKIVGCEVKAHVKHGFGGDSFLSSVEIQVRTSDGWKTIWELKFPWDPGSFDTLWTEVCTTIVNDTISGIRFSANGIAVDPSSEGRCTRVCFWIDDVYVGQVGIEEKDIIESRKLKVYPNPFVKFASVSPGEHKIQIYDRAGRLVKESDSNIIGEDLPPGFYFLKRKDYKPDKPLKVVKIGGAQ